KAKVAITKVTYTPQISNARAAVKEFNANPLADLECFTKTLDRVESDLGAMRARANAWARGNVDAIRKLPETDHTAACNGVFLNSPLSKALGGIDVRATLEGAWIGAAERALQRSRVSVAVLPVTRLVEPGGYLEALRSKGYQVEEPE
ncbi:MAG TPA: TraB/GumN family protein, partial [Usitatibacteraceae bacterium]|nr:TraB/GumN family protein [Usitatibacteraceae bacterium]